MKARTHLLSLLAAATFGLPASLAGAQGQQAPADLAPVPLGAPGEIVFSGVCVGRGYVNDPDRTDQCLDIALKELEKVKTDLNDDEVQRAKNKIASSLILSGEVPIGRMRSLGGQWMYNKEYRSLEKDMATLNAVTPTSLRDLMRKYPFDPMTIVTLGPESK